MGRYLGPYFLNFFGGTMSAVHLPNILLSLTNMKKSVFNKSLFIFTLMTEDCCDLIF